MMYLKALEKGFFVSMILVHSTNLRTISVKQPPAYRRLRNTVNVIRRFYLGKLPIPEKLHLNLTRLPGRTWAMRYHPAVRFSKSAPKDSHVPVSWASASPILKVIVLPAKLLFPYWNIETLYCPSATTAVATGSENSATQAVTKVPSVAEAPPSVAEPKNRWGTDPAARSGSGTG